MASHDEHALPDVVISGALALDLVAALEWAQHHAGAAETEARDELANVAAVLEYDITEAEHAAYPQRWVVGVPPDYAPARVAVLDEPPEPRPVLHVTRPAWVDQSAILRTAMKRAGQTRRYHQ